MIDPIVRLKRCRQSLERPIDRVQLNIALDQENLHKYEENSFAMATNRS